jgi:hypothetical protein
VGEKKPGESDDSMARASAGRGPTGRAEGEGVEKTRGKKEMSGGKVKGARTIERIRRYGVERGRQREVTARDQDRLKTLS